jgi:hypothetical protein
MNWMIEKTDFPLKTTVITGRLRLHRIKRKTWSRSMIELLGTKVKWSTHRHRSSRKRWSVNALLILFWENLSMSQREKLSKMSIRIMWGRVWSRVKKGVLQSVKPSTWKSWESHQVNRLHISSLISTQLNRDTSIAILTRWARTYSSQMAGACLGSRCRLMWPYLMRIRTKWVRIREATFLLTLDIFSRQILFRS